MLRWRLAEAQEVSQAYSPDIFTMLTVTVCLGIHLARMELRLATSLFFRALPNSRVSSKEGMSSSDMEMSSTFLMAPKGHRCLIEV